MSGVDVQKLADEAELNSFHYLTIGWVIVLALLDGYDIGVTGAALPAMMADLKIDATTGGGIASASLIGMAFGSALFGMMADKFGRKISVTLAVATFSLLTAAAGFVRNPIAFGALRFFAGLGLGGLLPILIAMATEYAPVKYRARIISLAGCGYAVGGIAVALVGKGLIESYGWQAIFFVAGAPVVLIPLLFKSIPESLSLLVKQRRGPELREMVNRIAPDYPPVHALWAEHLAHEADGDVGLQPGFGSDLRHRLQSRRGAWRHRWRLAVRQAAPQVGAVLVLRVVARVAGSYGIRCRARFDISHCLRARRVHARDSDPHQRLRRNVLSGGNSFHGGRPQLLGRAGRIDHRTGSARLAGDAEPSCPTGLQCYRGRGPDRSYCCRHYQPQDFGVGASRRVEKQGCACLWALGAFLRIEGCASGATR